VVRPAPFTIVTPMRLWLRRRAGPASDHNVCVA
jgi:hypothetical protein